MAKSKYEPMRTLFAIQRPTAHGGWETTQLFFTAEYAMSAINKRADAAGLRVEAVQREIFD